MANGRLYKQAKEAIQALFGDTSVTQEQTLESLELLADEIGMLIEAIEADLERGD